MAVHDQHPSDERLAHFAAGKLSTVDLGAIGHHLKSCPLCREKVKVLPMDSFVERLKQAAGGTDSTQAQSLPLSETSRTGSYLPPLISSGVPVELASLTQYAELRELGRGGMGVVYLAKNVLMDRFEVLKIAGRELLHNPEARERFLREIRAAARLQHPHVVAAYSAMEIGEVMIFSMEFVPGTDLAKLIAKNGRLPVVNACYYTYQVALGLQAAHEKEMVHRDIKPANLMLAKDGKKRVVKILDFGLAKARSEDASKTNLTRTGAVMGTPDYIAPEQSRDTSKADIRADIYSLGCTLYCMLSGKPPFIGTSVIDVLLKHQQEQAIPVREIREDVSAELSAVIAKMMAKDPAERYQTPAEVSAALKPFFLASGKTAEMQKIAESNEMKVPTAVSSPFVETAAASSAETTPHSPNNVWAAVSQLAIETQPITQPLTSPGKYRKWMLPAILVGVLGLLFLAAGLASVIKVKTPNGTIVVENVPDDAVVVLDDEVINLTRNGKTITIREVKEGQHTVKVMVGDVEMLSEDVTVKLDGQPVRVKYEAKPKDKNTKASDPVQQKSAGEPVSKVASNEFVPLFNGKDLSEWQTEGRPNWKIDNSELIVMPGRIYTNSDRYKDFHLRAKVYLESGAYGCIRCGVTRASSFENGYLVVLNADNKLYADRTGSVRIDHTSGRKRDLNLVANPVVGSKKWFNIEIILSDNSFLVKVNDRIVSEVVDTKRTYTYGHISLQNPRPGYGLIRFRDIEINKEAYETANASIPKVIPFPAGKVAPTENKDQPVSRDVATPPKEVTQPIASPPNLEGFTSLFKGKDNTGWDDPGYRNANWNLVNGAITASGKNGYLQSARNYYRNFHLRAEVVVTRGRGGLYFRHQLLQDKIQAYEVVLDGGRDATTKTGSLLRLGQPNLQTLHREASNPNGLKDPIVVEVIAIDDRFTVKINGVVTANEVRDAEPYVSGRICLMHHDNAELSWRKIEIKELPANAAIKDVRPKDPQTPDIVTSFFEMNDSDGWAVTTMEGDDVPGIRPIVQNFAGYWFLAASDANVPAAWGWQAPAKYHGNQSHQFGKLLKFRLTATPPGVIPFDASKKDWLVRLEGGEDCVLFLLRKDMIQPGAFPKSYTSYKVRIDEKSNWRRYTAGVEGRAAKKDDIMQALGNVKSLWIRGEFSTGPDSSGIADIEFGATK